MTLKIIYIALIAAVASVTIFALIAVDFYQQGPSRLVDDFTGVPYVLAEGAISPNGLWYAQYNGNGSLGVKRDPNDTNSHPNNVFYEHPGVARASDETHAGLAISAVNFQDFNMSIDTRTDKQLRVNDPPNTWETAWVFWHWTDETHHYYFVQKTNGVEIGKYDGGTNPESQIILKTDDIYPLKIGDWSHWNIVAKGSHISISVNGTNVFDFDDISSFKTGKIGLYCEDSSVSFDNVRVEEISTN